MNLPHGFENPEAVGKIDFSGVFFEQVTHHQVMGGTADNADVGVVCKRKNLIVIGDIVGRLPGIAKTGQTVGCDTGDIVF